MIRVLLDIQYPPLRESESISCRVLAALLDVLPTDPSRKYLLSDYWHKSAHLSLQTKQEYAPAILKATVPREAYEYLELLAPKKVDIARDKFDVALLVISRDQLIAMTAVFAPSARQVQSPDGLKYWVAQVSDSYGSEIRVLILMVGDAGVGRCDETCLKIFMRFDIRCCILCTAGTAADSTTQVGDVVFGRRVVEFELSKRRAPAKRSSKTYLADSKVALAALHFGIGPEWHETFRETVPSLADTHFPLLAVTARPHFHIGCVALGPSEARNIRRLRNDGIEKLVFDTEGSGFARACRRNSIQWLVLCGVFATSENPRRQQDAQHLAAATVASAAFTFLRKDFQAKTF